MIPNGASRIRGRLLSSSITMWDQVRSSSLSMINCCGPETDFLILSTSLMPWWCLGRVTLNSMVSNFKLRPEITFISVSIRSLHAFTIFSLASIQMILGVPLSANVLQKPLVGAIFVDFQVQLATGEAEHN